MQRHQFTTPDGLFPQNWPQPDEDPNEANRESHLIAALIMDASGKLQLFVFFTELKSLLAFSRSATVGVLLFVRRLTAAATSHLVCPTNHWRDPRTERSSVFSLSFSGSSAFCRLSLETVGMEQSSQNTF
eukprot:3096149-Amphidinium_carterae.1